MGWLAAAPGVWRVTGRLILVVVVVVGVGDPGPVLT